MSGRFQATSHELKATAALLETLRETAAEAASVAQFIELGATDFIDLIETERDGFREYRTTGFDPQMTLLRAATGEMLALRRGRYRFVLNAQLLKGRMHRPRLYLNFGAGYSEAEHANVFLKRISPTSWTGEIAVDRPIRSIRLDPSEGPVHFVLTLMALEVWSSERLSVAQSAYIALRAAYSLLGPLAMAAPLRKIANAVADRVFGTARDQVRQWERARTHRPLPEIAAPPSKVEETPADLYYAQYLQSVAAAANARAPSYAPLAQRKAQVHPGDPRIVAFYLPQFHPIAENSEWWGLGFTDWRNVAKAVPQFAGHYQPRLPGELGHYDLRAPETMARQIELARQYGVSGFCFHYFWFGGKRLLERPIEAFLADKSEKFDFPFCLNWANENWTRRWDGAEQEVLLAQSHSTEDHVRVFADLARYFVDKRYIRVDGKPLIMIYRTGIIPKVEEMIAIWRREAEKAGFPGIYIVATTAFGFDSPADYGFDALCQFPPHAVVARQINDELALLNSGFSGAVYDYNEVVDAYIEILDNVASRPRTTGYFPGVMTAWDNEARRPGRGHVFHRATPAGFHRWLETATNWTSVNNSGSEQFVFINAWNEWAEGAYLEPDAAYGYANLAAVAAVRDRRRPERDALLRLAKTHNRKSRRASDAAIFLHLFHEEMIDEFAQAITWARRARAIDVVVTIPNSMSVATATEILEKLAPTRLIATENKGRDIWPFIAALRATKDLGYRFGCKLHSKKSAHLSNGDCWRRSLVESLIGAAGLNEGCDALAGNARAGLAAPSETFLSAKDPQTMRDNSENVQRAFELLERPAAELADFVAGTMFWFRVEAMNAVANSPVKAADFGPELGAIDGTLAHAFERLFPTLVASKGFEVLRYAHGSNSVAAPY